TRVEVGQAPPDGSRSARSWIPDFVVPGTGHAAASGRQSARTQGPGPGRAGRRDGQTATTGDQDSTGPGGGQLQTDSRGGPQVLHQGKRGPAAQGPRAGTAAARPAANGEDLL